MFHFKKVNPREAIVKTPSAADNALIFALDYLNKEDGLTGDSLFLYSAEIKQYKESQLLDYVSSTDKVSFVVTLYSKLLIALPGEELYSERTLYITENKEIPATTGGLVANEARDDVETVFMMLTPEKMKIMDEIRTIFKKTGIAGGDMDAVMGTTDPLIVKVNDEGYEILKGEKNSPVFRYQYNKAEDTLKPYDNPLETTGGDWVPNPDAKEEPEHTIVRIDNVKEYLGQVISE